MCYYVQFGRSALKDVGINVGEPTNLRALELCSFWMGGVADRKIHAPPDMCHHVEFGTGSSATEGVRINRKEPPKLGSAETPFPWGVIWLNI